MSESIPARAQIIDDIRALSTALKDCNYANKTDFVLNDSTDPVSRVQGLREAAKVLESKLSLNSDVSPEKLQEMNRAYINALVLFRDRLEHELTFLANGEENLTAPQRLIRRMTGKIFIPDSKLPDNVTTIDYRMKGMDAVQPGIKKWITDKGSEIDSKEKLTIAQLLTKIVTDIDQVLSKVQISSS